MGNRLLLFVMCLIHRAFTEGSGDNINYDDLAAMFDFSTDGSGNKGQDNILDGSTIPNNQNPSQVLCYRCGEDGGKTCDIEDLKARPQAYIHDCRGHCLNISSSQFTVYTCTAEPHGGRMDCIFNDVMNMCACATDLCNGPKDILARTPNLRSDLNGLNTTGKSSKNYIRFVVPLMCLVSSYTLTFI
ncbi:hypothetical protein SNE40_003727 [Patella caerulea]|uniref:Uncharacterized protein n=1 Tax=Patella caerulea TaxID=87958 RepID=A0AAN8K3K4_PATCE